MWPEGQRRYGHSFVGICMGLLIYSMYFNQFSRPFCHVLKTMKSYNLRNGESDSLMFLRILPVYSTSKLSNHTLRKRRILESKKLLRCIIVVCV